MGKDHLKRLAAPKTWQIRRKDTQFVTKPMPGPHIIGKGISLNTLLKEILEYANTTREVKKILHTNDLKVDGTARKDFRFPVGIFDTVEIAGINVQFRIILNRKGKLQIVKISRDESKIKPCKIIGKTMVNGKLQLNLYDGKNVFTDDKSCKVGDTVVISLPDKKITKHVKLDKKSTIFLTGGKHIGETGIVEDVKGNKIIYKDSQGNMIETSKDYAFVIGENKPLITLES